MEQFAWQLLRGHRLAGFRFRRQQPIPPYIADFYCSAAKLVIELDGDTHVGQEQEDQHRQAILESYGLKVLRFWNTSVCEDPEMFTETVYRECVNRVSNDTRPTQQITEWGQFEVVKRSTEKL